MEGLVKTFLFALSLFFSFSGYADFAGMNKRLLRVSYYNNLFGHVKKNPSRYSQSQSAITCGHPVKIYKVSPKKGSSGVSQTVFNDSFYYVKVGPYWGYINKRYLSKKKPNCFQDEYPRFFDKLDLKIEDYFYWGKLYDQFIYGKSRVQ